MSQLLEPRLSPTQLTQKMTIAEAKRIYQGARDVQFSPAFRDLLNRTIDSRAKTEFKNDSYLDALFLTEMMLSRAQQSIRIFTSPCADGFFSILQSSFDKAVGRIKDNGGRVRVVLLNTGSGAGHPPTNTLDRLIDKYSDTLLIARARSTEKLQHFTVCDSVMARVEEVHEDLSDSMPATTIRAKVFFNDPIEAKTWESVFDAVWEKVYRPAKTTSAAA